MLLQQVDEVLKYVWSNNLIHMVEVILHVNIQLNMLSHSTHSVDLSLLNRCCLNSELIAEALLSLDCWCAKKEREGSKSYFRSLHQCTIFHGGRETVRPQLILVITVDHIAASVYLNYAATALASEDSKLCGRQIYTVQVFNI